MNLSLEHLRRAVALKERIEALETELDQLIGHSAPARGRGGRRGGRRRRSAATRAKMAAAQRARWAKRGKKKGASASRRPKRRFSKAARARIAAAARARWAKAKAAGKRTLAG